MLPEALVAAFAIMLASLAGVLFVWKGIGPWVQKNLHYLVTFAAGVFLVTTFNLVEEVREFDDSLVVLLVGMLAGAAVLEIATRLIPHAHHHHTPDHAHPHSRIDARRMLMGDAIHNIGDGILLVPAFLISPIVGAAAAAAIFLHEVIQEISEFFVLKEGGYSNAQALLLNFLVSSTILVGVVVSSILASVQSIVAPLIAFSAGGFLYIIVRDLLPSTVRSIVYQRNSALVHITAGVLGIAVMLGVNTIAPDSHGPSETHEEHAYVYQAEKAL